MATIKSYSDLQQSRKLAEILPLESADMSYSAITEGMRDKMIIKDWEVTIGLDPAIKNNLFSYRNGYVFPCWSLAALLGVLPTLDDRNAILCKDIRYDKWHVNYHSTATLSIIDTERYDNPVDACVDMIEKLHELKML